MEIARQRYPGTAILLEGDSEVCEREYAASFALYPETQRSTVCS